MSYQHRARVMKRPASLSGVVDTILDVWEQNGVKVPPAMRGPDAIHDAETKQCLAIANQKVAELDNRRFDLVKNWNPTGIYTTEQFDTLINATMAMLRSGSSVVDRASKEPMAPAHRDVLAIERGDIQRKMNVEGMVFIEALNKAKQQGIKYVDAPGLKRWITNSMGVASSAVVAANVVMCMQPWWVSALAAYMNAFNVVYAIARAVVGMAADVAKLALKVPDAISTMLKYGKWAVLAGAAYWLYEGGHKQLLGKIGR